MYLTFPKLCRKLYYSSFALWFSGSPFPHLHLRRLFLGEFSPNGVWAVICHVPLSVTQTRWQGPWGISSHCATWTTNTCAYIMAGSEKEHGDGRKLLYIQPGNTREKSSQWSCKGGRAALIMTIPWEDNLHYISGGTQPLWEEKAAVNAAEYTRLMLLEGFGEEGLWLPVQAGQRTSHEIAYIQDCSPSLTWSAPLRDTFVTEKLKLSQTIWKLLDQRNSKWGQHGKIVLMGHLKGHKCHSTLFTLDSVLME